MNEDRTLPSHRSLSLHPASVACLAKASCSPLPGIPSHFHSAMSRKKPDWNQVPPSCVNVRQVIEPLKPLPIHVRELKTEVLPRDVVKSRTVENGPSASHLDCRCRVRYTSTGIPCWGRCPHRRGAGWPHTPATSGCGGGGEVLTPSRLPHRPAERVRKSRPPCSQLGCTFLKRVDYENPASFFFSFQGEMSAGS